MSVEERQTTSDHVFMHSEYWV